MKFIKSRILLITIFLISCLNAFGYINLAPSSFDKNIGKGGYQEFTLYNQTSIPFRYKITPIAMENNKKVSGDMSKWIEVYPKIVTVKPQDSQKFKVYIKAPKETIDGDYGAFLNIRQMSAPKLKNDEKENVGVGAIIMVNLNLGIYGYVGDETPKISYTMPNIYKKDNKAYLKMKLKNETNRLVKMKIELEGKKGYIYPVGEVRAFKGENLAFDNEILNLKDGKAKKLIITDTETDKVIEKIKLK